MWEFLVEPLSQPFMQTALIEMTLLSVLVGVVGTYVVLRNLSYFTLALSHGVFPGIVLAYVLGWNYLALAIAAGILISLLVAGLQRNRRVNTDAAIAAVYTGMFGLGIVLVSSVRTFRGLSDLLFGRTFGISWDDILTTLISGIVILALMFGLRRPLFLSSFDPNLARATGLPVNLLNLAFLIILTVTVLLSLPAVGNIQLVALFVTPPAAARLLTERLPVMMLLAGIFAFCGSVMGLYAAYHFKLVPGATVIVTLTLLFLLVLCFAPRRGLVFRLASP
jgi:manganese/iron transport system permease protein